MDFNPNTQPDTNPNPDSQNEQTPAPDQSTTESSVDNNVYYSGENSPYIGKDNPVSENGSYNNYNTNSNNYNPNNNNYNPNNGFNNYPNNNYYDRSAYQRPIVEPGSSFATASMILGIISIVSSFTFTVYPAFVMGSIAIVLALLSKGRRPKLLSKATAGVICATCGLVINTVIVVICTVLLFTDPDVRAEVNKTFEKQYGMTFDEMWDEIMEDNGF